MIALKRILCYLKGMADYSLVLGGKNKGTDLIRWTDSDWTQDSDDHCSVAGFMFDITGWTISWPSKKQPTVALFIVEAEYIQ